MVLCYTAIENKYIWPQHLLTTVSSAQSIQSPFNISQLSEQILQTESTKVQLEAVCQFWKMLLSSALCWRTVTGPQVSLCKAQCINSGDHNSAVVSTETTNGNRVSFAAILFCLYLFVWMTQETERSQLGGVHKALDLESERHFYILQC